jgi:hypothetical protein
LKKSTFLTPKAGALMLAPVFAVLAVAANPAAAAGRDPLKQPFASNSIWNMPIGSNAQYVAANLKGNPGNNVYAGMPYIDEEKIIMTPTAPLTNLNFSSAGWSGKNRCAATGGLVYTVPMPSSYVVPHSTQNNSAAFLLADKRTIVQTQPLTRCTAGAAGTTMAKFSNVDLYGTGITGAHGGSGLSAIGGSIRIGEMRPGTLEGPRHHRRLVRSGLVRRRQRQQQHRDEARRAAGNPVLEVDRLAGPGNHPGQAAGLDPAELRRLHRRRHLRAGLRPERRRWPERHQGSRVPARLGLLDVGQGAGQQRMAP